MLPGDSRGFFMDVELIFLQTRIWAVMFLNMYINFFLYNLTL